MATATYPYDPAGDATTNRIVNELHNVQPVGNISDASFIIPRAAPFFLNSLKIKKGNTANAEVLLEGIHYITTHHFVSMSYLLGTPLYSSITFLNRNYSGNVYLDYQSIGGDFVLNSYAGVEELTRQVYSVYSVTWEQVAGLIQGLPPTSHFMAGSDTTGYGELVDSVKFLAATIRDKANGGASESGIGARLDAHLTSSTSHTKDQVGLNRVENYAIATNAEARSGSVGNKYVTPLLVMVAIKYYLDQAGISSTPVSIETLMLNYTNLASRVTGVNDNLNTVTNNLTNLAGQVDSIVIQMGDIKTEFLNNINNTNQQVDLISRELLQIATNVEDIKQDIFFNETEIVETNRKLDNLTQALEETDATVKGFTATIKTLTEAVDKLNPSKNPEKSQFFLGGFHKIIIPGGCKAKVTMIGAVSNGNTDPDTKLFEGSKYESSSNSYYAVIPNPNSPVATVPGGVSGTLTGRIPSHSLPNAVIRSGNNAALFSTNAEGVTYTGGDGHVVNSVTYGTGITGSPTVASAGASLLETTINNATTTPLIYHVYVGEGQVRTTLAGLVRINSGICIVELTVNP